MLRHITRTKILLVVLVCAAVVAAAAWLLPWWLSLSLLVIGVAPLLFIVIAFLVVVRAIKSGIKSEFPELVPKKQTRKLAANETFQGNGFRFTLPVACEVSQTVLDDFEALMLKPKLLPKGRPGDSMLIVSTIPKEEMKSNVTRKLDEIFSLINELKPSEFVPLEIGPLHGECRTFEASKDGTTVRGESAYLGDHAYSVAWQIITERDEFDAVAEKYREFARLIQRVPEVATAR
jgi:hypothetical protein